MKFGIFDQNGALNSEPVFAAFRNGLNQLGLQHADHDMDADVAVIWSLVWAGRMKSNQEVWQTFRQTNRSVVVLEVGSILRGLTWKLSLHNRNSGVFYGSKLDPDRPAKLNLSYQPWREDGRHILIALQRGDSEQWVAQPHVRYWLNQTIETLRRYTDRPIIVRNHPRKNITAAHPNIEYHKPSHLKNTYDSFDFESSLKNAWAVVNWNSSAASRAVVAGIPAFVGPNNFAASVSNLDLKNIESPRLPDRYEWAIEYANSEWLLEEIATGEPIKRLFPMFYP